MKFKNIKRQGPVEIIYNPGLVAKVNHVKKTITIEFKRISPATMDCASKLVESFAIKGYDNVS